MRLARGTKRTAALLLCILLALLCAGQALAEEIRTPDETGCDHGQRDYTAKWEENVRFTSNVDGLTHTRFADIYGRLACLICGDPIDEHALVEENAVTRTEEHHFSGGVCVDCGYVCTHSVHSMESEEYQPAENWRASGDGENHVRVADHILVWQCAHCHMMGETALEGQITQSEPHSYGSEGACTTCGFVKANCPHTNTQSYKTWDREHQYVESYTAEMHIVVANMLRTTYCKDCGRTLEDSVLVEENVRHPESHDFDENGACFCGYKSTCQHTQTYSYEHYLSEGEATDWDNEGHTVMATVTTYIRCSNCYTLLSKTVSEPQLRKLPHEFMNGSGACMTAGCGAVQTCTHEKVTEEAVPTMARNFVSLGKEGHEYVADVYRTVTCDLCGTQISFSEDQNVLMTEKHYFEDGVCAACGYRNDCTHPNLESHFNNRNIRSAGYLGNGKHSYTADVYLGYYCPDCESSWEDSEPVEIGMQGIGDCHYNSDNVCVFCGAAGEVCQHPSILEYKDIDLDTVNLISSDSQCHVYTADVVAYSYCPDCGERFNERVADTGVQFRETHDRWIMPTQDGSICDLCGYTQTCAHEHVETVTYPANIKQVLSVGPKTHTLLCNGYEEKRCADCGTLFSSKAVLNIELTDRHYYNSNGICNDCGYQTACTHENREINSWYDTVHDIQILDGKSHGFFGDKWECWECPDCGFVGNDKKVADNEYFVEEHFYEGGDSCYVCGMAKPEVTPTPVPAETPVPTPVPTREPENDFVPTPRPVVNRTPVPTAAPTVAPTAVPEKKEIVSTLFEAVAEAEAEGKAVEIEIVGAQEVMTQEEFTELKTLSAQEQVLVTLKSVGLDEVVQAAISAMKITVSGEAQGLMDRVGARMEKMTVEEKTAYEDKLAEYFPMTERVIGGVTVRTFTIDMKIVVDGFERVERYQFYLDENGEWVFEKVDLASFGKA